jgi:hypothetical protein
MVKKKYRATIKFHLPFCLTIADDNLDNIRQRADNLAYFHSENIGYTISIKKDNEIVFEEV